MDVNTANAMLAQSGHPQTIVNIGPEVAAPVGETRYAVRQTNLEIPFALFTQQYPDHHASGYNNILMVSEGLAVLRWSR